MSINMTERPKNWNELNDLLWQFSRSEEHNRYRPYVAFRGLPRDFGNLRTSLQRIAEPQLDEGELAWRETRLIDSYRSNAYRELPHRGSDWEVLLMGQHYRLPTRLLDWTSSPYAALFFATEDTSAYGEDGVVWCVRRVDTNRLLPANLTEILREDERGAHLFHVEALSRHFPTMRDFDRDCPPEALLWFEPPSTDIRIINQYALFSVMPNVAADTAARLAQDPLLYHVIPIPKELKQDIRDRLMVMNISERTMYPGLEGIARWHKAYYGVH